MVIRRFRNVIAKQLDLDYFYNLRNTGIKTFS